MEAWSAVAVSTAFTNLNIRAVEARVTTFITKLIQTLRRGLYYWTGLVLGPAQLACTVGVKLAATLLDVEETSIHCHNNS